MNKLSCNGGLAREVCRLPPSFVVLATLALLLFLPQSAAAVTGAAPSLGGVVLDRAGGGLEGATVQLFSWQSAWEWGEMAVAGRPYPAPAAEGLSAADGSFQLQVPETGIWGVAVLAPGRVPVQAGPVVVTGPRVLPPVSPPPDVGCAVLVRHRDGRPAAGAETTRDRAVCGTLELPDVAARRRALRVMGMRPEAECLGHALHPDLFGAGEVSDRAGDPEDDPDRPDGQPQAVEGVVEELPGGGVRSADRGEGSGGKVGVEQPAAVPLALPSPCGSNPLGDLAAALAAAVALRQTHRVDRDVEVDEFEQALTDRRPVAVQLSWRAGAVVVGVAEVTARAGTHGGGEQEGGRCRAVDWTRPPVLLKGSTQRTE